MAVYKRPGSTVYSYDFRHRGRRFSGSTGQTTKREAAEIEKLKREEAKADVIDTSKPLTFTAACALYWSERGQYRKDADALLFSFAWLQREIGKTTELATIDDALVARLVARRRGETRAKKMPDGTVERVRISNATVNRSMTEPLRALMQRARTKWKVRVQEIDWHDHKLKEPQVRVREASAEEEALALAAIPADYRAPLAFALMTGCRRAEIVGLTWQAVDFFNREFRVRGKGDRWRTVPMTEETHALLWSLKDHHPEAVFTYVAKKPTGGRIRGRRYPITVAGFQTMWARHVRGKLTDFRFHDTRHTAATRLVRATGNLKLAMELLGHSSVTTTSRYSHVTKEDLRAGLELSARARSATEIAAQTPAGTGKALKKKEDRRGD